MFEDFKTEIKLFVIVAIIAVVVSVAGILLLRTMTPVLLPQPVPVEQQAFTTQKECEEKTDKKCFLFQGLCQVMVAQNAIEEEENEKFLRNCEKQIGTWQPTEETLEVDVSTPTSSPSNPLGGNSVEGWQTYRNDEFGFEVKYPIGDAQCVFKEVGKNSFVLGRIDIAALDADRLDLGNYVKQFVTTRAREPYNWTINSQEGVNINGVEGIRLTYRFGALNRYAEAVFLEHASRIFVVDYSVGAFLCNEPEVYQQILSTFRFVE